jgi:hypothetical protein
MMALLLSWMDVWILAVASMTRLRGADVILSRRDREYNYVLAINEPASNVLGCY